MHKSLYPCSTVGIWWCCSVPCVVSVCVCVCVCLWFLPVRCRLTCFTSSSLVWMQWPCHPARSHRLRWGQTTVSLLCRQRILHTQIKAYLRHFPQVQVGRKYLSLLSLKNVLFKYPKTCGKMLVTYLAMPVCLNVLDNVNYCMLISLYDKTN